MMTSALGEKGKVMRYIEADKTLSFISRLLGGLPLALLNECEKNGIDIVRCKECRWADWYKTADGEQFCYCMETDNGGRTADDFCSYGEREDKEITTDCSWK